MNQLRQHPFSFVIQSLKITVILLIYVFANFNGMFTATQEEAPFVWGICALLVGVCLFVILYFFLVWRKTFLYLNEKQLTLDKQTTFFKKKITVRLENISAVNLQRGIWDYLFGTCRLKIDSNALSTADTRDFNLVFSKAVGLQMQQYISAAKNGEPVLQNFQPGFQQLSKPLAENEQPTSVLVHFSTWQVIRHALLSTSLTAIVTLGAAFAGVLLPTVQLSPVLYPLLLAFGLPAVVLFTIFSNVVRCLFRYHNFTVYKQDTEISVSFGLITQRSYFLPTAKTNALFVRQTPLGRIFGLYRADIINLGMGDRDEKIEPLLCLMLPRAELTALLQQVAPEYSFPSDMIKQPRAALLPLIFRALTVVTVITALCSLFCFIMQDFSIFLPFFSAVFFLTALWVLLSFITRGLNVEKGQLTIVTGVFMRKYVLVPFQKIQLLQVKTGPLSRLLGLARGQAHILAPTSNRVHAIGYFKKEFFHKIFMYWDS